MNCDQAERQIFAERDGAPGPEELAALASHVAQCPACRRTRVDLAAAIADWQLTSAATGVPDAEREWQAVRRRMRSESSPAGDRGVGRKSNLIPWLAVPLAAAAAGAIMVFVTPPSPRSPAPAAAIAASSATATANDASTVVFVDEKSGWLVVWASAAGPKQI